MDLTQGLLTAVAAETGVIISLFGIQRMMNKQRDKRLDECEADRSALHDKCFGLQQELISVWRHLATGKMGKRPGGKRVRKR